MEQEVIKQTKKWIEEVVVGCNFCPFAAKELKLNSIRYVVSPELGLEKVLSNLIQECIYLDKNKETATTLVIFPEEFKDFSDYLYLLDLSERLLEAEGYAGIYQIASFHPDYLFANSEEEDPSNYTNRSIFPMLHLLREESVSWATKNHPDAEGIPATNIAFTNEKGLAFMKNLRNSCLSD